MGETKTLLTPRLRMKGVTTGSLSVEAHEGRIFALNTPPEHGFF
ncbi:MAG: hypothetical protein ACD_12C00806G0005 [uncultured bacterium]|nr:MAG: hypothetical protein ACD_12C00806G0005 [uncultured bacterium]